MATFTYLVSAIIISFAIQFLVYFGIGIIVAYIIRISKVDWFAVLILGLFGLTFILLIEHFFMPIDTIALILPVGVSIIGWFLMMLNRDIVERPLYVSGCCRLFLM